MGGPETQEDTFQTTEELRPSPLAEKASGEGKGTPTDTTKKSYTAEELAKAINDAKAPMGRQLQDAMSAVKAAEDRVKAAEAEAQRFREEQEKAELQKLGNDPDQLSLYHAKKADQARKADLDRRAAELAREKQELAEAREEVKRFKLEKDAREVAAQYEGVDPQELLDYTDGSRPKMEILAKRLAGAGVEPRKQILPGKPDSGISAGGSGRGPTNADLENMTMGEYAEFVKKRERFS